MAWVAVDKFGIESIFDRKPHRNESHFWDDYDKELELLSTEIELPKGIIRKLIGRDLTWKNEPVEI